MIARALVLVVLAAALAPIVDADTRTTAGAGAVSVRASSCTPLGGGAWSFSDGSFFATVGRGPFRTAVLTGDGSLYWWGDRCTFVGRGAIVADY